MVCTLASGRISANLSQIWGSICGGNGVSVKPYAYPQLRRRSNVSYMYAMDTGCGFDRFYSPNQSVVAWFTHMYQERFQPILTNLGKCLWW
jgi:hypothetical protein